MVLQIQYLTYPICAEQTNLNKAVAGIKRDSVRGQQQEYLQ